MSDASTIRVCAVGDLMLGDSAKCIGLGARSFASEKGCGALFAGVEPLLSGDVVFGNLECVLCDRLYSRYSFTRGQMCASPAVAGTLAQLGFNVLSVANNHAMQYGAEVFRESCAALTEKGIAVAGVRDDGGAFTCRPAFIKMGAIVVGILAYSTEKDNYCREPLYATGSAAEIVRDVELLRGRCDHVIVSMHWGCEFVTSRSSAQAELGRKLVDAGADVVIGHHPHVVQEVELYHGKPIFYSLGNFVSDMVWDEPLLESVVARVELQRGGGTREGDSSSEGGPFSFLASCLGILPGRVPGAPRGGNARGESGGRGELQDERGGAESAAEESLPSLRSEKLLPVQRSHFDPASGAIDEKRSLRVAGPW